MKKIIYLSLIAIAGIIVYSCNKEEVQKEESSTFATSQKTKGNGVTDKANTCSCSSSTLWSSCSITCPVRHGICLANCTTVGIGFLGSLGTVAVCTCGSIGAGKGKLVPGRETYFDEVNIGNLSRFRVEISNKTGVRFTNLKDRLDILLENTGNPNGEIKANHLIGFMNSMEALNQSEQESIIPFIEQLKAECGRQ